MDEQPKAKISLGEAAYRRLRADIMSCRLAPGERLTERQLTDSTGFGATPIRAALTRLDHEGLVLTLPRKGYKVSPLTPRSIENLFEVWSLIGPEIFRRGVLAAGPAQHAELVALFQEGHRRPDEDTSRYAKRLVGTGERLTQVLVEATRNDYYNFIVDRLAGDMARVWTLVLIHDPGATVLVAPGAIEGIVDRNGEAVARGAGRVIAAFRDRVLDIVRQWPSVVDAEIIPGATNESAQ